MGYGIRYFSVIGILIGLLACNSELGPGFLTLCSDPVPVTGHPDPPGLGYIVGLREEVDAQPEITRLEAQCGFEAESVFTSAPGFHAVLSPGALECVRCDPVVESIDANHVFTPNEERLPA